MGGARTRRRIVAGNWKMNPPTREGAVALAQGVVATGVGGAGETEVVVAPPACFLDAVAGAIAGSGVVLAAQNLAVAAGGAFTGELSGSMLRSVGCTYVIVGHSERRTLYGEDDALVGEKAAAVFREGMIPIICVGETLEQRQAEQTFDVVRAQVDAATAGLDDAQLAIAVIAYEPVWAIGTGLTATPEQAQEVHRFIRDRLAVRLGAESAGAVRIQYGGSMKPANAAELLACADIDGGLIGGASLKADSFEGIIRA